MRLFVCLLLFTLNIAQAPARAGEAVPQGWEETVQALEEALQRNDFAPLEGLLAPGFTYAGHSGALARTIMRQVVAAYAPGLTGIEVREVRTEPDGSVALRAGFLQADGAEEHTIRIGGEGRLLQAEVARIQLAAHAPSPDVPEDGTTERQVELERPVVRVPFELRDEFPVPLVEVHIGDRGPYLFAVDTAAACTAVVRRSVATELGLEAVGTAAVGDGSGRPMRAAEMVRVPELRFGGAVARDLEAVSHVPSAAHAASIPEDAAGILGRVLFESVLLTLDYPARELVVRRGRLEPGPSVVGFDLVSNVMQIPVDVAGQDLRVFLDSGHRGTITLPASWAEKLPLAGPLVDAGQTATVNVTYTRQTARLAGTVDLAGVRVESPALFFADEHTPSLLGGGLLRELAVTIDQRQRLVRVERTGGDRVARTE